MANITFLFFVAMFSSTFSTAPDPSLKASMARYIMQEVGWVSMATISTLHNISGYPFANVKLVSDGFPSNGTGVPYFLMTDLDFTGRDVEANNKITVMTTLAEKSFCEDKHYDPQDPRCPRLIMSGRLRKLKRNTAEYSMAHKYLKAKHPIISTWELVHNFYVATIDMEVICLLDAFGGASFISIDDYLKAKTNKFHHKKFDEYRVTLIK